MTECPVLSTITNETTAITDLNVRELLVSTYDRSPGAVVRLSCNFNLVLDGADTVTCTANGWWAPIAPTCQSPTTTTTTTASPGTTGLSQSAIVTIVLAVIAVFVFVVMVIICVAIYYNRWHRRREKITYVRRDTSDDADTSSQVYSISERHTRDGNFNMYNIYSSRANSGYDAVRPQRMPAVDETATQETVLANTNNRRVVSDVGYRPLDGVRNQRGHVLSDDNYIGGANTDHAHLHHSAQGESGDWSDVQRMHHEWDNRRFKCPYCNTGKKAAKFTKFSTGQGHRHGDGSLVLRDKYLWRDAYSNWSLRIPRPLYEKY